MKYAAAFFMVVTLTYAFALDARADQPAYQQPRAPWQAYSETTQDPDLGRPFAAYRLSEPGKPPQELIVYKLFTSPIAANLGTMTEEVLKEYYPDATFSTPKDVTLCDGMPGSTFEYTGDVNHDGRPIKVSEVISQAVALYAIAYRRDVHQNDDEQAKRVLSSLCPPRNEAQPTPPPFTLPAEYPGFSAPSSFTPAGWQTENSTAWTRGDGNDAQIIALRHQPSVYSNVAQYGAAQTRLAKSGARTLYGFRRYVLQVSKARSICSRYPVPGWYTQVEGDYFGRPSIAEQTFYVFAGTLYSAAYLRPASAPEDPQAHAALMTLCPRDSLAGVPAPQLGEGAAYLFGDFLSDFDVAYEVKLRPEKRNRAWTAAQLTVGGDDSSSASLTIGIEATRHGVKDAYTQTTLPGNPSKMTRVAAFCNSACTLELRGSDVRVEALFNGKQLAAWPRGRFPAIATTVTLGAAATAIGDRVSVDAHPRTLVAQGLVLAAPACGFAAQGIEPRILSGGEIAFTGARAINARTAYLSLRTGRAQINCKGAMREAQGANGAVGRQTPFLLDGKPLAPKDGRDLYMLAFAALKGRTVWKDAAEMPDYAPMFAYAGRDASGQPIFWHSRAIDDASHDMPDAVRGEETREMQAANAAAAIDAGYGGNAIQTMAKRFPATPEGRMLIGYQVFDALRRASEETVADSAATRAWIVQHIEPGMTREQVERALQSVGLKATTTAQPVPNCPGDLVADWMYEGTYADSQCTAPHEPAPQVSTVGLAGAFEPGCSFSTDLDIVYDARGRVERLDVGNAKPDCL